VPSGQIGSSLGIPSPWATCVGHVDPDDCDCCAAGRECCGGGGGGDARPRVSSSSHRAGGLGRGGGGREGDAAVTSDGALHRFL